MGSTAGPLTACCYYATLGSEDGPLIAKTATFSCGFTSWASLQQTPTCNTCNTVSLCLPCRHSPSSAWHSSGSGQSAPDSDQGTCGGRWPSQDSLVLLAEWGRMWIGPGHCLWTPVFLELRPLSMAGIQSWNDPVGKKVFIVTLLHFLRCRDRWSTSLMYMHLPSLIIIAM